ncbi:MAG TPA: uroporphyrinogen decarboxylase family protein [Anaerolineae bacterium]|nr:uroporphyrinogen decarboxylase family protein [Anaerolineae bacterium]
MNSKERTILALRRREPDRVPVWVTVVADLAERLAEVTGVAADPLDAYLTNRISHAALLTALGNDVVGIGSTAPHARPARERPGGTLEDEWGFVYRRVPHRFGTYLEIVGRPLAGIDSARELAHYPLPDPAAPGRFDIARDRAERYGSTHALLGIIECTVFEMAWNLVGLERFLADMALGRDYVGPLLDAVAEYSTGIGLALIELGADALLTGDDLGMDPGPMLSPRMWRQWLKPRLQRVLDAYRAARPDIILAYHSCGSILPFVGELADMGIQVLNPVQVTARGMEPAALKAIYGQRLAFCGAIDQREVLPHGAPTDVEAEVRRRIAELGPGGGYLAAPTHDVQADTPVENVLALFEAVRRWGTYPLG